MKLNKAFILATAGAYLGLFLASAIGYPTVVGAPIWVCWVWFAAWAVFMSWSILPSTPPLVNQLLGAIYGAVCAVTFIGLENWGSPELNLAMALWDLVCAVCFIMG